MSRILQLSAWVALIALAKPEAVRAEWVYVVYNGQVYAMPQTANGYGPNPGAMPAYAMQPVYTSAPAYYGQPVYTSISAYPQTPVYYQQPMYTNTSRYGYNNSQSCARTYRNYPKGARGASAVTPFGPAMDIEFGNGNGPGYPAQPHTFDAYGPSWDEHDDP